MNNALSSDRKYSGRKRSNGFEVHRNVHENILGGKKDQAQESTVPQASMCIMTNSGSC